MVDEETIRVAYGSDNIDYIEESKNDKSFIPQKGDIFVWRRPRDGHTGVVTGVSEDKKTIFILEAIGSSGSADNKSQPKNQVREAQFKVGSKALSRHVGWIGYFRPQL
jgi:hypothetical protein